jgi:predicted CoA-binding protein
LHFNEIGYPFIPHNKFFVSFCSFFIQTFVTANLFAEYMTMETNKITLVIGATTKPDRYGNIAIKRLRAHGHTVLAIGVDEGTVADVPIGNEKLPFEAVDTVTLYVRPAIQHESYEDYILGLKPKRVIFNPGTENPAFEDRLQKAGIEPIEACTLVMLSTGQY